jgi:hypothetical protein
MVGAATPPPAEETVLLLYNLYVFFAKSKSSGVFSNCLIICVKNFFS